MSSYLIDTHIWLWMDAEPARLRGETRELVDDVANELLLSAASAWEIAVTYRIGKLPLPEPPGRTYPSACGDQAPRPCRSNRPMPCGRVSFPTTTTIPSTA